MLPRVLSLLLVGLFVAPIFASTTAADPVSTSMQTDIDASFGAGAPFGAWEYAREDVTFWMHMDGEGIQDTEGEIRVDPNDPGSGAQDPAPLYMDLKKSALNPGAQPPKGVLVGSNDQTHCINVPLVGCVSTARQNYEVATFSTLGYTGADDENRIYSVEVRVYFDGLKAGSLGYAVAEIIDQSGNRVGDALPHVTLHPASNPSGPEVGGQTPGIVAYEGIRELGKDGRAVPDGGGLRITIGTAEEDISNAVDPANLLGGNLVGPPAILLFDTTDYPSFVNVRSDSARINVWTEDIDNRVKNVFPSANINENTPTNVADRQLLVHVLQANAWGADQFNLPGQGSSAHGEASIRLWLVGANGKLVGQDITSAFPDFVTGARTQGNPSPISTAGNVLHSQYHYIYPAGFEPDDGDPATPRVALTQDGTYRLEAFNDHHNWHQVYRDFVIGGRDFTFRLADGEVNKHTTLVGQPTEFSLVVRNNGVTTDTMGLALPSAGTWGATFNRASLTLVAGQEETVTLRITPPASAGNGDSRNFVPSAASLITNTVKSLTLTVEVTNVPSFGVDLSTLRSPILTRPDILENSVVQIRNTGNAAGTFVIRATGAPTGWSVSLTPPSAELLSQSRQDLFLRLQSPPDAPSGQSFVLTIEAFDTANAAITDVLEIPVSIYTVQGVKVEPLFDAQRMRSVGPASHCVISVPLIGCQDNSVTANAQEFDGDYDRSAISVWRVTNTGDVDETFTIEGYWDPNSPYSDASNCDGNDGIPDHWRFGVDPKLGGQYPAPDGTPSAKREGARDGTAAFSGIYTLGTLQVAAKQTEEFVLEHGWNEGGSNCDSNEATWVVQVTDQDDRSFTSVARLAMGQDSAGSYVRKDTYTGAQHGVAIVQQIQEDFEASTPAGTAAVYNLIAVNRGNEVDTLSIRVDAGLDGWLHEIVWPTTQQQWTFPAQGGKSTGCSNPDNHPRRMLCTVGPGDPVYFQVRVTPPAGGAQGVRDEASVVVTSQDDTAFFDDVTLTTRIGGIFAYTLESTVSQLQVMPEGTAFFPFTIRNLGNEDDTYLLSVPEAQPGWTFTLSEPTRQVFVPAGHQYVGFLRVAAPAGSVIDQEYHFRLQAESVADPDDPVDGTIRLLDFFAKPTAATGLAMDASSVLVRQGTSQTFTVEANDLAGGASTVTVSFDPRKLPQGWSISAAGGTNTATEVKRTASFSSSEALPQFTVTAPNNALGTSRVMLRATGLTDTGHMAFTDVEFTLTSAFGVQITALYPPPAGNDKLVALPGQTVTHTIEVKNTGLSRDTIDLTFTDPPTGWTLLASQTSVPVEPLQTKEIPVEVTAPANAEPGAVATILAFGSSAGDSTKTSQTTLRTEIGSSLVEVSTVEGTVYAAPEESVSIVVRLLNNGTVVDTITPSVTFTAAYVDRVPVAMAVPSVQLKPGQAADVLMNFTMPSRVVSNADIVATITGTSSATATTGSTTARFQILPHVAQDVDHDGASEFAVDRDRSNDSSFEEFRESSQAGGIRLAVPNLEQFLTADARNAKMVTFALDDVNTTQVFVYSIDGDGDGRLDMFLDRDLDNLPDVYWDPDNRVVHNITLRKDVTKDSVPELFIDTNGDRLLDRYFDLTTGNFGNLIQQDVDGDGRVDYIVDLDGDGVADSDEPVLLSRTNGITVVERIDVDGDGRLDQVFDIDGDGIPDYFIPEGSNTPIQIKLRDVTGDGVADWTYDSDGDGRVDRYFDPATGKTGTIDTTANFFDKLAEYWYVSAMFALVAALFVVLVVVTRR